MTKFLLKHKYPFITIVLLIIFRQLFLMFSNLLNADAITVLTKHSLANFIKIMGLLAVVWICIIIIDRIVKIRETIFLQDVGIDIKNDIAASLIALDIEKYKKQSSGVYQSWLNNDIQIIQDKGIKSIFTMIYHLSGIIFSMAALLTYHWMISIITLLGTMLLIYLPKLYNNKIQDIGKQVTESNERYVSEVEENVLGYDTLFSLNRLSTFVSKLNYSSQSLKNIFVKQVKIESNYYALNFGLNVLFQVILIFVTGYLVITKDLELGAMASVGMFANLVFEGMSQIGYQMTMINGTRPILTKFNNFFDDNQSTYQNIELSKSQVIFNIKDLTFNYQDRNIFESFNLKIISGKKYLISGESGSGKSTLFKILTGQLRNYEGTITYYDVDLKKLSSQQLFEAINFIPQKPFLFSGTIKDNMIISVEKEDRIIEHYLEKVGFNNSEELLYQNVGFQGDNLSGGQKQKIIIARALLNDKKIILIDEGTSALDKDSAEYIEKLLLTDKSLTVLMISHSTNHHIEQLFDDIIEIKNNHVKK